MTAGIPPPPLNSPNGSYYWLEWYTALNNVLNGTGYPWTGLNFSGSNIADIINRSHNSLQNVQGGNASGTATPSGNAYHAIGMGYVDIAASTPKLPTGWSVVHTSTGVYTISMTTALVPPNFIAGATSNTAGTVVQWIDVSGSSSFIVHTSNSAGTAATDASFSFWVTQI